ncbi:hypothetical protein Q7P37_010309 [Cladosporium fusiforme]
MIRLNPTRGYFFLYDSLCSIIEKTSHLWHGLVSRPTTRSTIATASRPSEAVLEALERRVAKLASAEFVHDAENPFFIVDLGVILRQSLRWRHALPDITPYYAVKCNSDPKVLRVLADLGAGFDCASATEINGVLSLRVDSARIMYAHPYKTISGLQVAREAGIERMTFDSIDELDKIKELAAPVELLLRIWTNDHGVETHLSQKFGARLNEVSTLVKHAKHRNLDVVGIAFHVGTQTSDPEAFVGAIRDSRIAFRTAGEAGVRLRVLDIGGGFTSKAFENTASAIRQALAEQDFPDYVELIAEPGRFFVETAFTLACKVIGLRAPVKNGLPGRSRKLYLSDGIFGNFANVIWESQKLSPGFIEPLVSGSVIEREDNQRCVARQYDYSLWGPTCDGNDRLVGSWVCDRDIRRKDWLYFPDMGAYSSSCKTRFNGLGKAQQTLYVYTAQRLGKIW